MEKINELTSENIVQQNIERLKEIFPTAFSEGKLVIEELQALVGEYVQKDKEFYQMTWAGKTEAQKEANKVSTGTLRPCKEESKDWDSTENIFIEGDNLEVLKLLQKSYSNKIKMIYIDPPYNTGKDFVYKDNYKDNLNNYLELTGQKDEEGKKLSTNTESDGRYHSNWLNMMYPRLKLARNLLKDDGVILINMDENESVNLSKLLEEIYGSENNLGTIIWDKRNPKGDSRGIAYQHEEIMCYAKNKEEYLSKNELVRPKKNAGIILSKAKEYHSKITSDYSLEEINRDFSKWINSQNDFSGGEKAYRKIDENGDVYRGVSMAWPNKKKAPDDYFLPLIHPITKKACPVPDRGWRYPSVTMQILLKDNLILFGENENKQPERKYLLKDNLYENLSSILYYGGSDTELLQKLQIPFDTPKVINVIKEHIQAFTKTEDYILDFFAGSGTTAHSVLALNAEENSSRKYISVQLPEPTDEKSEAYKEGYKTIAEITKERIRRAGELVKQENKNNDGIENLDTGFRVFKLDSSNILAWDTSVDEFEGQLDMFAENNGDHIKSNRTEEDVLFEILLKYGLELTLPIEGKVVGDCKIYNIGFGSMYICLSDQIKTDVAKAIGEWHKESSDTNPSVIFKDSGFANDADKTNTVQTLRQVGIENVKSI
ncbi:adenine-specific DNA-methyltransferase [Chryseobacterium taichungense]|uniref:site-specific DNA-methyltransferase (adenine-specific) n=1 Tax=Chryseobacterium taichungense TaxID=295069 RepID=A0A1H7WAA9_9FLAO|nr:site-specific DNA-methyltransferase [Chryseobacterium taichungense]SEM18274.1 adenine-specific DNA-methyltransferase [Chryseobacterium taichungense]